MSDASGAKKKKNKTWWPCKDPLFCYEQEKLKWWKQEQISMDQMFAIPTTTPITAVTTHVIYCLQSSSYVTVICLFLLYCLFLWSWKADMKTPQGECGCLAGAGLPYFRHSGVFVKVIPFLCDKPRMKYSWLSRLIQWPAFTGEQWSYLSTSFKYFMANTLHRKWVLLPSISHHRYTLCCSEKYFPL